MAFTSLQITTENGEITLVAPMDPYTECIFQDDCFLKSNTEEDFEVIDNSEWLQNDFISGIIQYSITKSIPEEFIKEFNDVDLEMILNNANGIICIFKIAYEMNIFTEFDGRQLVEFDCE